MLLLLLLFFPMRFMGQYYAMTRRAGVKLCAQWSPLRGNSTPLLIHGLGILTTIVAITTITAILHHLGQFIIVITAMIVVDLS